jgi:glycosyltransferase involved in cell wall biosynthesis
VANADSQPRPQISVVIPVYHSARTLPELIARLLPVLDRMGDSYEVILVEDGSKDQSWEVSLGKC